MASKPRLRCRCASLRPALNVTVCLLVVFGAAVVLDALRMSSLFLTLEGLSPTSWQSYEQPLLLPSVFMYKEEERCPIHTYFEPDRSKPEEGEAELRAVEVWRKNWYRYGWAPIVNTEKDARKHPQYEEMKEKFAKLPTKNSKFYELQCYLRWLAMVEKGGGYMVDYDILNFGWRASEGPDCGKSSARPVTWEGNVPMLMKGSPQAYQRIAELMANYTVEEGEDHLSDMLLNQRPFSNEYTLLRWRPYIAHWSHNIVLNHFGNMDPLGTHKRHQVLNKMLCYLFSTGREITTHSLPMYGRFAEHGTALRRVLTNCLHPLSRPHPPSSYYYGPSSPLHIFLLPPTPLAVWYADYLQFLQKPPEDPWYTSLMQTLGLFDVGVNFTEVWINATELPSRANVSFEGYVNAICGHSQHKDWSNRILRSVLERFGLAYAWQAAPDHEKVASAVQALSNDGAVVVFWDQASQSIELLDFQIGLDIEAGDKDWLVHEVGASWNSTKEALGALSPTVQACLLARDRLDVQLIALVRRQFEARAGKLEAFKL